MTSNRAGLIAAILEDPDDDVARLIFADYLEENDESEYAQFIRTQVQLASVPHYDPLWIRCRFTDRDMVSGKKIKEHLPELPHGVRWAPRPFERGFPACIEVADVEEFLTHAADLFAVAPIQSLEIQGWRENLAGLADSPYLGRLRRLSFQGYSHMHSQDNIQLLQGSPHAAHLTHLEFANFTINSHGAAEMFEPPLINQLTHLHFHGNALSRRRLARPISEAVGPWKLRSLAISNSCQLLPAYVFRAPLLQGLAELDVAGCELGPAGVQTLVESQSGALASLNLRNTFPQVAGIRALVECPALSGLRRLVLGNNRLGPVALKHLAQAPHLANLHVLDLSGNPIGDKGAISLAESPYLRNLLQLELMDCGIGDMGAHALLNSPLAGGLVHLNLLSTLPQIGEAMKKKLVERFGQVLQAGS